MGKDLRQFLQVVKEAGTDYYVEVKRPLKPKLEVCILLGFQPLYVAPRLV